MPGIEGAGTAAMTDFIHPTSQTAAARTAVAHALPRRRVPPFAPVCAFIVTGAAVAGLVLGRWSAAAPWDPPLAALLRFMAAIKFAGVIAASALVLWRVRTPLSSRATFASVAALASMALAPGLIWSLAHIVLAAALFHAGLLTLFVLAWRDGRGFAGRDAVRRARSDAAPFTMTGDQPAPTTTGDGTTAQLRRLFRETN